MAQATATTYSRPRSYVRVSGPEAGDYLQRMVSNDVLAAPSCEAMLLTPKGRVIAPLVVWRRGVDDFLLLTEPELGDTVIGHLTRMRIAAKCEIEREEHTSTIVFGPGDGIPNADYGQPAVELLDDEVAATLDAADLERLRIEAGTPRFGRELDDRVLPEETGVIDRVVSFTKGCYPGQEPIARQHNRGKINRRLRVLELARGAAPEAEAPVAYAGKDVGRITSAVPGLALAYVRVEVPDDAELDVAGIPARLHLPS